MSSRRVITVHLPTTVVKILPKYDTDVVLKLFSPVHLHCCDCLGISSWMRGADCWPVSESGTENISASDLSSESPGFFVDGKKTEPTSPVQPKILERVFAAAEHFLHLLIGNWFLSLSYGLRRQYSPFF